MADEVNLQNLTQHQNFTDRLMTTMGENLAAQQALMHIPPYDGKNIPFKNFIQDVETGYNNCPEGIRNLFFRGVVSKLRGAARDTIGNTPINSIEALKNALKDNFSPKKGYGQYCAEIQGIRMRKNENVTEYHFRVKELLEGAKAALTDSFTQDQIPNMVTMLEGIALESFKRGLADDLLYAVSVTEPENLAAALAIARRVERNMATASDRSGGLNIATAAPQEEEKRVQFQDAPWKRTSEQGPNSNPRLLTRSQNNRDSRAPDRRQPFENRYGNASRGRSPTPPRYPINYPYYPYPMPGMMPNMIPYPMHMMPPQQQLMPYQFQQPYYFNNMGPTYAQQRPQSEYLNSQGARRPDAAASAPNQQRPPANVKLISAEELAQSLVDEE